MVSRKIVFIVFCIIWVIMGLFVFQNRPKYSYFFLGKGAREKSEEINENVTILQEVPYHVGDKGVSFQITTNGHKIIGSISVLGRGKTSGSLFFETIVPGKKIQNNQFVDFIFDKDIPKADEVLEITFASDCKSGTGAALLTTGTDSLQEYAMIVNDVPTSTDAMMRRIVPSDQAAAYWIKYGFLLIFSAVTEYIFLLGSNQRTVFLWRLYRRVNHFFTELSEVQTTYFYFLLAIILATCWIVFADRGNYPAETAVGRYIIVFAVFFFIKFLPQKIKDIFTGKLALHCISIFLIAIASIILTYIFHRIGLFSRFSKRHVIYVFGLVMIIYILIKYFNKSISENLLLASIVFFMGSVYAFSYPATTGISWDDQIHYQNTVDLSHFPGEFLSQADRDLINKAYNGGGYKLLHEENPAQFENDVNDTYKSGK